MGDKYRMEEWPGSRRRIKQPNPILRQSIAFNVYGVHVMVEWIGGEGEIGKIYIFYLALHIPPPFHFDLCQLFRGRNRSKDAGPDHERNQCVLLPLRGSIPSYTLPWYSSTPSQCLAAVHAGYPAVCVSSSKVRYGSMPFTILQIHLQEQIMRSAFMNAWWDWVISGS